MRREQEASGAARRVRDTLERRLTSPLKLLTATSPVLTPSLTSKTSPVLQSQRAKIFR
jgi:hypothetical protein